MLPGDGFCGLPFTMRQCPMWGSARGVGLASGTEAGCHWVQVTPPS